jgi:hypothetical protein
MKKIFNVTFICTAALFLHKLQAQIITVTQGTDMTIKSGTVFSADGIVLTPSTDFTLSNTKLNRRNTVSHPIADPYIARVYQFSNITNPYSGSAQINYQDGAELKGIPESRLSLSIHNGTAWKIYAPPIRDAVNNFVNTAALNGIKFNELTLADDCPAPSIQCYANIVVNATAGKCGAAVNYKPPVITDICGGATIRQIAGLRSGEFFPVGNTINTFLVTGASGKTATHSFIITVYDKEAPIIKQVSVNPAVLPPANHTMKDVTVNYNTWDNCGSVISSLSVCSNEPVTGTGNGDVGPDWVIVDNHHLKLRAERAGNGHGRIYTITITSKDAAGNITKQSINVLVQHDNGGHGDGKMDDDHSGHKFECKVMPNPSKDYFTIQIESTSYEDIEANLFDVNGKLISKLTAIKKSQSIRFGDNLRPGVYLVEVKQGEQRKTIQVIKQ